jgi:hypothetical protein
VPPPDKSKAELAGIMPFPTTVKYGGVVISMSRFENQDDKKTY